jgi:Cerato-platanin
MFGDLPNFPNLGGKSTIKRFDSPECGSCWGLTYTKGDNTTKTIYVTAVDGALDGWIISRSALQHLGGEQAVDKGDIEATAERVAGSKCGFKS